MSNIEFLRTSRFKLKTKDGRESNGAYSFTMIRLNYGGRSIDAGLAQSFFQHGIPVAEYGKKCKSVYSRHQQRESPDVDQWSSHG